MKRIFDYDWSISYSLNLNVEVTLNCEKDFEDVMHLCETNLYHHASHRVIYIIAKEHNLARTYAFYIFICTYVPIAYAHVNA